MLAPQTLRRIEQIELVSRRLVHTQFAGSYQSVFKGQGLVFHTVRPYEYGDDVRAIDWKITARTGEPHIKQFVEERERTVMLVIDSSASVLFGSAIRQKSELAAELGSVLASTAIYNDDKVGLLVFSDKIEHYIPPKKGRKHVMHLIRELLNLEPIGTGTDFSLALQTLNRALKRNTIVFLLSDFLLPSEQYKRDLLITSQRHDTTAIILRDPLESLFPNVGMVRLQDAETQTVQWVDTDHSSWQREFQYRSAKFERVRETILTQAGIDRIDVPPDGDYVGALIEFFNQRMRRR